MNRQETCPVWCDRDHQDPIYRHADPGEHSRDLAVLDDLDNVDLYWDSDNAEQPEVLVWVGGNDTSVRASDPARLRALAAMLQQAADELDRLDLAGEKLGLL